MVQPATTTAVTPTRALAKDMGEDDALEWFSVNTTGAWVGAATPRFLSIPEEP